MAVQDAFGHPRLVGDRPTSQAADPVTSEHALGGGEQLCARIAQRNPGRHEENSFAGWRNGRLPA
jgi:hypothetical protein